jgi:hypothetical protein
VKANVQNPGTKQAPNRTSPVDPSLFNSSNNKPQPCSKTLSASSSTPNPQDRIQYGGKSLKILKNNLINSDPHAYENLQFTFPDESLKGQTTVLTGQPQTTSNIESTKIVVRKTSTKRHIPKTSNVKAKRTENKPRILTKQIHQIDDVIKRPVKTYVSKTLIQPSSTRTLVRSPPWTPNRLFQNSIVPGILHNVGCLC